MQAVTASRYPYDKVLPGDVSKENLHRPKQ